MSTSPCGRSTGRNTQSNVTKINLTSSPIPDHKLHFYKHEEPYKDIVERYDEILLHNLFKKHLKYILNLRAQNKEVSEECYDCFKNLFNAKKSFCSERCTITSSTFTHIASSKRYLKLVSALQPEYEHRQGSLDTVSHSPRSKKRLSTEKYKLIKRYLEELDNNSQDSVSISKTSEDSLQLETEVDSSQPDDLSEKHNQRVKQSTCSDKFKPKGNCDVCRLIKENENSTYSNHGNLTKGNVIKPNEKNNNKFNSPKGNYCGTDGQWFQSEDGSDVSLKSTKLHHNSLFPNRERKHLRIRKYVFLIPYKYKKFCQISPTKSERNRHFQYDEKKPDLTTSNMSDSCNSDDENNREDLSAKNPVVNSPRSKTAETGTQTIAVDIRPLNERVSQNITPRRSDVDKPRQKEAKRESQNVDPRYSDVDKPRQRSAEREPQNVDHRCSDVDKPRQKEAKRESQNVDPRYSDVDKPRQRAAEREPQNVDHRCSDVDKPRRIATDRQSQNKGAPGVPRSSDLNAKGKFVCRCNVVSDEDKRNYQMTNKRNTNNGDRCRCDINQDRMKNDSSQKKLRGQNSDECIQSSYSRQSDLSNRNSSGGQDAFYCNSTPNEKKSLTEKSSDSSQSVVLLCKVLSGRDGSDEQLVCQKSSMNDRDLNDAIMKKRGEVWGNNIPPDFIIKGTDYAKLHSKCCVGIDDWDKRKKYTCPNNNSSSSQEDDFNEFEVDSYSGRNKNLREREIGIDVDKRKADMRPSQDDRKTCNFQTPRMNKTSQSRQQAIQSKISKEKGSLDIKRPPFRNIKSNNQMSEVCVTTDSQGKVRSLHFNITDDGFISDNEEATVEDYCEIESIQSKEKHNTSYKSLKRQSYIDVENNIEENKNVCQCTKIKNNSSQRGLPKQLGNRSSATTAKSKRPEQQKKKSSSSDDSLSSDCPSSATSQSGSRKPQEGFRSRLVQTSSESLQSPTAKTRLKHDKYELEDAEFESCICVNARCECHRENQQDDERCRQTPKGTERSLKPEEARRSTEQKQNEHKSSPGRHYYNEKRTSLDDNSSTLQANSSATKPLEEDNSSQEKIGKEICASREDLSPMLRVSSIKLLDDGSSSVIVQDVYIYRHDKPCAGCKKLQEEAGKNLERKSELEAINQHAHETCLECRKLLQQSEQANRGCIE